MNNEVPYDRRQLFMQVRYWVKRAGWRITASDGTVHQFPVLPGHNPTRWKGLEANRGIRKALSPFAYTYFVAAVKR